MQALLHLSESILEKTPNSLSRESYFTTVTWFVFAKNNIHMSATLLGITKNVTQYEMQFRALLK